MLHPRFFAKPDHIIIRPGMKFQITGYAQVSDYTLVQWRLGPKGGSQYATGETLYKKRKLIASGAGQLPLYEKPKQITKTNTPQFQPSVWDRIDNRLGKYGVPPSIAIALREPRHTVYFDPPGSKIE